MLISRPVIRGSEQEAPIRRLAYPESERGDAASSLLAAKANGSGQTEAQMRYMMSLPAPVDVQETFQPSFELVTAMRKYTDDMRKAGVLLFAEGFDPS